MKKVKKIAASLMAVAAMVTSISSIEACAYINEYSTSSLKASSTSINTTIYARNKYNSYSDFLGSAAYYNNGNNALLGNDGAVAYSVPNGTNASIYFTWDYNSTLPAITRVEVRCRAYVHYTSYAQPYETWPESSTSTSYVYY